MSLGPKWRSNLCEEDAEGEDDVGDNTGGDDKSAFCDGAVLQKVRVLCFILALRVIVRECHIAAQGDCAQ